MKTAKSDSVSIINESLLGGAALSLSDLERVESQEIEWLFVSNNKNEIGNETNVS